MKDLDITIQNKIKSNFYRLNEVKIHGNQSLLAKALIGNYDIMIIEDCNSGQYHIESRLDDKLIEYYDAYKLFDLATEINLNLPIMYREKGKRLKNYNFENFIKKDKKINCDEETIKTILLLTVIHKMSSFDFTIANKKLKEFCLYLLESLEENDSNKISEKIMNTRGAIPFGA